MSDDWPWQARVRLPKFGSAPGLERVRALAAPTLAQPWGAALDALKVTGSNGKGSASAMLAALLDELGFVTGLFTSPHLFAFNERIAIAGRPAPNAALERAWDVVQMRLDAWHAARPGQTAGAFEAFTLLALQVFADARVQACVAEAGIGGRHDPTRALPGRIALLTSLDLEHTALLGSTLSEIARDKADLCAPGGTLVSWVDDEAARRALELHCAERGVHLLDARAAGRLLRALPVAGGLRLDFELHGRLWRDVELGLRGPHQARNALVALVALDEWLRAHRPDVSASAFEQAARRALARLRWPLRFEQVGASPDVFADVGHTPDALRALAETVRLVFADRPVLLLIGVSRDKDAAGLLAPLAPLAGAAICTQAHHRGRPAGEVVALLGALRPGLEIVAEPDIAAAVARARERAVALGLPVLIAGGLFVAAEATCALRGGDPRELRFF